MMRKFSLKKYKLRYSEKLKVSEDYDLWSRAIRYLKFANLPEILLHYRVLDNSNYHGNKEIFQKTDDRIR